MTLNQKKWKCAATRWSAHSARVLARSLPHPTCAFARSPAHLVRSLFNPCARTCALHLRTPLRTARLLPARHVGKILQNCFYVLSNPANIYIYIFTWYSAICIWNCWNELGPKVSMARCLQRENPWNSAQVCLGQPEDPCNLQWCQKSTSWLGTLGDNKDQLGSTRINQ